MSIALFISYLLVLIFIIYAFISAERPVNAPWKKVIGNFPLKNQVIPH